MLGSSRQVSDGPRETVDCRWARPVVGGPITQLAGGVVAPAKDIAPADAAGMAVPGNEGLEGARNSGGNVSVQPGPVAKLTAGVQSPTVGPTSSVHATGVVPAGHQVDK